MARDEARHAGFLNKAMGDFKLSLDLGEVTKTRTYTFFPIEWVLYTCLSIGKNWLLALYYYLSPSAKTSRTSILPNFPYNLKVGVRMKTDMGIYLRHYCDRNLNFGIIGNQGYGVAFFLLSVFATHTLTVHERAVFTIHWELKPQNLTVKCVREHE